ncbi:helix-turn-helix domain-containing protein [Alteromonas sp. HB246098]|jgi:DNA-binding CsgD family transcriptional regulator
MNRIDPLPYLRKPPFDSDKPEVEKLIYDGKSDAEIAHIFNVTKDTIWSRRKRWNLPSGSEIREAQIKDGLTQMWIECYTPQEMAEVLGINEQTVYAKLNEYRIRDIPRMGINAPVVPFASLKQGITPEQEDEVWVISHNRVPKWALVPIDQYKDLIEGVYDDLRS